MKIPWRKAPVVQLFSPFSVVEAELSKEACLGFGTEAYWIVPISICENDASCNDAAEKFSTNPTSFIFCLYKLDTWFLNNFQSCSETCNMNAQPQAETLLRNIWKAEYSQFIAKLLRQQDRKSVV